MGEQTHTGALRVRVAELEAENRQLKMAQVKLDSDDRNSSRGGFVQTFGPLAQKPEVQSFVAKEGTNGIEQSVDIDAMVSDLFAGIAQLDLPPAAAQTLPLLEGTAANGVRSLIGSGVETVVESPQFAGVWETTLRETHRRAIAVIQGDPNSMLQLSDDGTLSLSLATVIADVKTALVAQGIGFTDAIPVIDRSVPILARTRANALPGGGHGRLLASLGGARCPHCGHACRTQAHPRAELGRHQCGGSLLLLSAGVGIGKFAFMGAVSPLIMPAATAEVVFAQLTELIASTLLALITLFVLIAVGAWFAGASRLAVATRGALESGFAAIRRAADARGLGSGATGRFVERWRSAILVLTVAVGVAVLFFIRPITFGAVVATLVCVLFVLCVAEVLRRPADAGARAGAEVAGI